jgi:hypothetical protein
LPGDADPRRIERRHSAASVIVAVAFGCGQTAMQKGIGWRKALRAAIADNPFVKGEGLSPKARRELLGHAQLTLSL